MGFQLTAGECLLVLGVSGAELKGTGVRPLSDVCAVQTGKGLCTSIVELSFPTVRAVPCTG